MKNFRFPDKLEVNIHNLYNYSKDFILGGSIVALITNECWDENISQSLRAKRSVAKQSFESVRRLKGLLRRSFLAPRND